jgi:hypothetical protein
MTSADPEINPQADDIQAYTEEPSVLDWFKSLLRLDPIPIPDQAPQAGPVVARRARLEQGEPVVLPSLSWSILTLARLRLPAAILLAMIAQWGLERRQGEAWLQIGLYSLAAGLLIWALVAGDLPGLAPQDRQAEALSLEVRARPLAIGLVLGAVTFLTAGGNQFRGITVLAWLGSAIFIFAALWNRPLAPRSWWERLRGWLAEPRVWLQLERWTLLVLVAAVAVIAFRYWRLVEVPYEMWSDQAEKLLDVRDVVEGDTRIFFPRNSGREAAEFYLAAAVMAVLGTGYSFLTLKLVSVTAGVVAVLFMYLLGKELGGRRAGLFMLLLSGFAFWPVIASRAGLRMPLNELAVAPAMYFFVRGLHRGNRNDFLWAGLAVGLGLQGYSGARVIPGVLLAGFLIYLLHMRQADQRLPALTAFGCLVLVSVIGFLPLFRVVVDEPELVLYRTLTRVGNVEQAYLTHPLLIFLDNMWDSLRMFSWTTGEIWVVTVPHRPALDFISGAFFHLGVVMTALAYLRTRRWEYLFLLVALPILLLPSALALAFPNENPAPNRVTGAMVPVFAMAGLALDAAYGWFKRELPTRFHWLAALPTGLLLLGVVAINGRLVFTAYATQQRAGTWNVSEAGDVMQGFAETVGTFDHVYFVVYPFWLDSRLAAIEAGAPIRDYSVWPADLPGQDLDPGAYHLYLIKPEDIESMTLLQSLHSGGSLTLYDSAIDGRDFYLFLVPPSIPTELPSEAEAARWPDEVAAIQWRP